MINIFSVYTQLNWLLKLQMFFMKAFVFIFQERWHSKRKYHDAHTGRTPNIWSPRGKTVNCLNGAALNVQCTHETAGGREYCQTRGTESREPVINRCTCFIFHNAYVLNMRRNWELSLTTHLFYNSFQIWSVIILVYVNFVYLTVNEARYQR